MQGLMQDWPLLVHTVLDHAAGWHGEREIVSRSVEGPIHRTTYRELDRRARLLASASARELGVGQGDIVASMAWNGYRHLEIWYGLMGLGAIVHTLNPRLFADQLVYIVNHAEDRWIFLDLTFVPVLESIAAKLPRVKGYVVMTDEAHMPKETSLPNVVCYESLLASGDAGFEWPRLDEKLACGMCYTSGTTGNPKGVLYSQRSNVLHGMSQCRSDALGIAGRDTVMPVVPMFHANAWSLAFSCPMAGAKMVMPGAKLDGASLYELIDTERVTMSAAVPTVWLMLLQYLEQNPELRLPHLERVAIGGSACPEHLMRAFEEKYDVEVMHAWGMTEMSPIGTVGTRTGALAGAADEQWWPHKVKQGRPYYGVEMKITDDEDRELPRDGKTFGRLKVRGHSVASSYFKGE
ncbi:MAG: AMP-binding protein, partial [Parvibaculaceae bacterium]